MEKKDLFGVWRLKNLNKNEKAYELVLSANGDYRSRKDFKNENEADKKDPEIVSGNWEYEELPRNLDNVDTLGIIHITDSEYKNTSLKIWQLSEDLYIDVGAKEERHIFEKIH